MAGIYCAALLLRLIPVLLTSSLGIGLDDMFQYDMLARSLTSGNGYRWYAREDLSLLEPYVDFDLTSTDYDPVHGVPTSFRAPLYPAFLALVYSIAGAGASRFFAARLAQAVLLGAPLAPLTYLSARSLLPANERAARISAWIAAAYPMLLIFPIGLGTENLFFLLLLLSFLFLLSIIEHPAISRFLLAGLLLGLTALTRSVVLPFAGLAVLWAWFVLKQKRGALLMALALTVTILPWVVRNSQLHGRLTGIETSMGYNLYVGYHPESSGTFTFGPSLDLIPILDDSVRDRLGTQKAFEFIQAAPGRFVPLAASRLGHFFRLELRVLTYFYSSNFFGFVPAPLLLALLALFGLPFAILSISAVLGCLRLPRSPALLLAAVLFLGYLLPHVFILSEERFHLALIPLLAIFAASAWTSKRAAVKSSGRAALAAAALVVALLLVNWTWQFTSDADKFAALLGPNGNQTYYSY
ncbi:MAG: glycosyltransferase family 39 protein [Chloroflexi bacterium]|nr:glycosyltransferase family 39 protein [Chloroflexota bacterium]